MTYRIKDWDATFENYRSRERNGSLSWVQIPTKQDGYVFRKLMSSDDGVRAYGIFIALVQIAAKTPERGTLADDRGPMTTSSLAFRIGCGEAVMREAMQVLMSQDVGWVIGDAPDAHPSTTRVPPVNHPTTTEIPFPSFPSVPSDGRAETPKPGGEPKFSAEFEAFWSAYPKYRRRGKSETYRLWKSKRLDAQAGTAMAALEFHKRSEDWKKDGGKYVPEPERWLKRDRWQDAPNDGAKPTTPMASPAQAAEFKAFWRGLTEDQKSEWAGRNGSPKSTVENAVNWGWATAAWYQALNGATP